MAENLGDIYVKIKADVRDLEKEVKSLKGKLEKDAKKMGSSFGETFKKGLRLAGGLLGLQAAVNFGRKIINTASEFEQLRTRLVSLYGSTDKATEVFKKFKKLAATTPFKLKDVVEAGATLKAFGMDAENTLKSVGDLAAFMGLDVVEAANAVGRAFAGGVGAADVLRERGVLNLIKSFKGIDDLTKLTLPEFRKALIEAMQDPAAGIAGSTDRMSKTFAGALSNMGDALESLAARIGAKLLPGLKDIVHAVTNLISPSKDVFEETQKQANDLRSNFEKLSGTYLILKGKAKLTNEEHKLLKTTIVELKKEYPNYLKNIDLEKINYNKAQSAIRNARIELEKYINTMLKRAALESNNKTIDELGKKLGSLVAQQIEAERKLKELQKKPTKMALMPYDNKSKGFTEKELYQNQLEASKRNIEKTRAEITKLEKERLELEERLNNLLTLNIKAPKDKIGENIISGSGKQSADIKTKIKLLEKEVDIYNELYAGSLKWYNKNMELIKAQTTALVVSGISKKDAIEFEKKKIAELNEEYDRLRISTDFLNKLLSIEKKIPEKPKGTKSSDKPKVDVESQLQYYYDLLADGGPFSGENGFVNAVETSMAAAQGFVDGFFEDIQVKGEWANSMLEKAFASMADAVIQQIQRMAAEWLAFQALKATFGFLGIPIPGGATGGTFIGTSKGVKKAAAGDSFIVPPGFPNDSYPMLVQSGERVDVTPAGRVNQLEGTMKNIYKQISVLNENMVDMMIGSQSAQPQAVALYGRLEGKDIYISNKRAGKQYGRIR